MRIGVCVKLVPPQDVRISLKVKEKIAQYPVPYIKVGDKYL